MANHTAHAYTLNTPQRNVRYNVYAQRDNAHMPASCQVIAASNELTLNCRYRNNLRTRAAPNQRLPRQCHTRLNTHSCANQTTHNRVIHIANTSGPITHMTTNVWHGGNVYARLIASHDYSCIVAYIRRQVRMVMPNLK